MDTITLLGGSLGAGKTTLLTNLLLNDSFTGNDGIIVMDAAGDVDYERVRRIAEEKGVRIENATSACTVCDGPESAFNKLETMRDLDHVGIELSGQMPLSVMNARLAAKGVDLSRNVYLVDPRNFALVQGADEVPFAHVVGLTKSDEPTDISRYNPQARVVRIHKDGAYTLDDFFEGVEVAAHVPAINGHTHRHSSLAGMVSKWTAKVHNPYHTVADLADILSPLAVSYDRIKGYVALDSERVFSFDGVQGEFNHTVINDPSLGNGTLLIANGQDRFFLETEVVKATAPLTSKPDPSPVIRRGSSRDTFETYIERALAAKQYDDALGASEQHQFETGDDSLFLRTLPDVARGKLDLIQSGTLTRSQRVLKGMSALYYLTEHPDVSPEATRALADIYKIDYDGMDESDWAEIEGASDSSDTRKYVDLVRRRL